MRVIVRAIARSGEWYWVGALVLVSAGVRAWLARGMVAPFVMVDELIYSELAKSFATTGSFAVRDVSTSGYGVLYPFLISPAYRLFDRLPEAYAAVKTVNSLTMSLAAIPAYLIARRVVGRWPALLAAALAVALPSMAYTGTVMTENLFYPLSLVVVWTLLLFLEQPSWGRSLLLLIMLGAALAVRVQALVLVLAAASAPLLVRMLNPQRGGRLRMAAPLYVLLAAAGMLVVLVQAARGRSLRDLLGAYAPVAEGGYDIGTVLHFWLWHLEEFTLYVGVIPILALLALVGRRREISPRATEHLAATVAVVFWTTLSVAAFASRFADRIQERNLFFVAPLVLVALLVWVESGAPRRAGTVPAAVLAVALVSAFPYGRFIGDSARADTLALVPLWSLGGHLLFGSYAATAGAAAVAATTLFLLVPRRYAFVAPLVLLTGYAAITESVWRGPYGFERSAAGALSHGIAGVPRDWIDRAVRRGAVAVVWTGRRDRFTVNENEFFNRRVGPVYYTNAPTPGGIDETRVAVDPATGVFRLDGGSVVRARFVLLDDSIEPLGTAVARDPALSLTLWRLRGPLIAVDDVRGVYSDGWAGPRVTYERRRCRGGRLAISLSGDTSLFTDQTTVVAMVNGRERARLRFAQTETPTLEVPLVARRGHCVVRLSISPAVAPAHRLPGATDKRVLGTRVAGFRYTPPS